MELLNKLIDFNNSLFYNEDKVIFCVIDGGIGSGKSTLLNRLRKIKQIGHRRVTIVDEPIDAWRELKDENGTPILDLFYSNPSKYAFPFQMAAFISRFEILRKAMLDNPQGIIISERSLYTDKMVFAKMLYDSGNIEAVNYSIYLKWFDVFANQYPITKSIYIKTNPEVCLSRIKQRGRAAETNIKLEYLESCHDYHEKMMNTASSSCPCNEQLVLDGNNDITQNANIFENWIEEIKEFIVN